MSVSIYFSIRTQATLSCLIPPAEFLATVSARVKVKGGVGHPTRWVSTSGFFRRNHPPPFYDKLSRADQVVLRVLLLLHHPEAL